MRKLKPGAEGLTDERIHRLHMIEKIEGEEFTLTVRTPNIVTQKKDGNPVQFDLSIQTDIWLNDEMSTIINESDVGSFMEQADVSEMEMKGVQIQESGPYLINAPIMVVKEINFFEDDQEVMFGSTRIHGVIESCKFPPMGNEDGSMRIPSFRGEPCFDLPLSLVKALSNEDEEEFQEAVERIRKFPGEFAEIYHRPTYFAACEEQEEELKWVI